MHSYSKMICKNNCNSKQPLNNAVGENTKPRRVFISNIPTEAKGQISLRAGNSFERIALKDVITNPIPNTAGSEIGFYPVYNHIPTVNVIRVHDGSYGGSTQITGHLYIYAGNNTTDNSLGNIILQHDGTNSRGLIGIGTQTPTAKLDINGTTGHSQFRLRTSYTPTSTSDTNGNTGDFSWDDNYFYIKTSAGWKRSALTTF